MADGMSMSPSLRKIRRCRPLPGRVAGLALLALLSLTSCRHVSQVTQQEQVHHAPVLVAAEKQVAHTSAAEEGACERDRTNASASAEEFTLTAGHKLASAWPEAEKADVAEDLHAAESAPELSLSSVDHTFADMMSLEELVALALANNPSIPQAAAIANKAMGVREQIGLCPNPIIGYLGQEIGNQGTAGSQGAFLSQTIVLGDKLAWNRSVANQEVQAQLWQVESQRYRVQNDVRRQFYETLGAQERIKLAEELFQIAEDGLENAQTLNDAQQAALPDVLQAKVQLQEVQIIQRNAAFMYAASWQRLAALVGLPHMQPVDLQPLLFAEQTVRDRETAWAQIVTLSPQLRQAYVEVQRAHALISRERVQPIPNLQMQVGVMHMNITDDNAAQVMLGLPVPIFNANEGNIYRSSAEYHRASQNVQRLELSLQAQLADSFSLYQQALNRALTYRDEILPAQAETLELIMQAYPLQFDFLRLLTARRAYYEATLEYLEAVIDLRQAEVALDGLLLSGGLSDIPDTNLDNTLRGQALSGQ